MESTGSAHDQALLERRLRRERAAREAAEALLNSKSRELFEALQSVSEVRKRLQLALWASGEAIWEWSARTGELSTESFDAGFESLPTIGARLRRDVLPLIHPEDRHRVRVAWRLHARGGYEDFDCEFRLLGDDGPRWVRTRGRAIARDERTGIAQTVVGTIKDVTRQRAADELQRLVAQALSVTREPMAVTTADWRVIEANPAFLRLTGLKGDGKAASLMELMPIEQLAPRGGPERTREGQLDLRHRRRGEVPVQVSVSRVAGAQGSHDHYVVILREPSRDDAAAALELMKLSMLDVHTQLPNRTLIQQHVDARLAFTDDERPCALLLVTLTGMREITESYGHVAAEGLLETLVQRLEHLLHPCDLAGRWSEDAFAVLLRTPSRSTDADRLARAIIASLSALAPVGDMHLSVPVNVGIVLAPQDGNDSATLLRRVDSAAYASKENGYNTFEFFRPTLDSDALTRVHLLTLLRGAVQREEFHFVVQPKVNRERIVVGGEVLIRWETEPYGSVSPGQFIPLAEESGLIQQIGRFALDTAAGLVARLDRSGASVPLAVNVSSRQARDGSLEETLLQACERAGVEPWMIELEITESVLIGNLTAVRRLIERLRSHGFKLSLDDFGTGYSSLTYLRELPFDCVKIDRGFVKDVDHDTRACALLEGIVTLCRTLGIATVAEGVETEAQFERLQALGVDQYQGYWFYRPLPLEAFTALRTGSDGLVSSAG